MQLVNFVKIKRNISDTFESVIVESVKIEYGRASAQLPIATIFVEKKNDKKTAAEALHFE